MKIETGIEVPEVDRGSLIKYQWMRDMKVGDSYLIIDGYGKCKEHNAYKVYCHRVGQKCVSRKTREGLRVWRVK